MNFKKFLSYLWMALMIFSLIGCTQSKQDTDEKNYQFIQTDQPSSGGELVLSVVQLKTLNPVINDNLDVQELFHLIYDGLIKLDDKFKPKPALAENFNLSADKRVWNLTLRNTSWHDGQPFTAEDVKFTIQAMKKVIKDQPAVYYDKVKHITNVRVVSRDQVSIEFDEPKYASLYNLDFPIIPKHQFNNTTAVYNNKEYTPIGTGSYKVVSYEKYHEMKLVQNEDYFEEKPYIKSILVKPVPDQKAALSSVEVSEVHVAKALDYDWEKYNEDKSLRIYEYITNEYEFLGFNFNDKWLKNTTLRKAIAYSIDRHEIVDKIYLGHATVVDAPIHPDSYLYAEEEKTYGLNLDKARELLKSIGWENKDDDPWIENESNEEVTFSLLVNKDNSYRMKTAEFIKHNLEKIGIHLKIDDQEWKKYQQSIFGKNFDIVLGGWRLRADGDISFALHSRNIKNKNFISYTDPKMDQLLDEATMNQDLLQKEKKYKQIQHQFVEQLPYLSLFFKNNSIIMKRNIQGDIMPKYFNIFNHIENWYVHSSEK